MLCTIQWTPNDYASNATAVRHNTTTTVLQYNHNYQIYNNINHNNNYQTIASQSNESQILYAQDAAPQYSQEYINAQDAAPQYSASYLTYDIK